MATAALVRVVAWSGACLLATQGSARGNVRVPYSERKRAHAAAARGEGRAREEFRRRERASRYPTYNASAGPYDWAAAMARLDAHRDADVARYDPATASARLAVQRALRDKLHTVWVFKGRVLVHKSYLGEMKRELHLRFLKSVLAGLGSAKRDVGNTVYSFDEGASGPSGCDDHLPALAIAKKRGDGQCGVLVPNPYFGDVYKTWAPEFKGLLFQGKRRDWGSRNPRLFWRGKIRGHDAVMDELRDCERDAGNFARLQACSLTSLDRTLFDVRSTSCEPRIVRSHKRDVCGDVFVQTPRLREIKGGHCRPIRGDFVNHGKFNTYQFLLDLPGSTTGSYSRNLNHLWLLGAVVVFWRGPLLEADGALQWYTPALADGATHVAVDVDTAKPTLEAIKRTPAWRDALLDNARGVATHVLCADCLASYFVGALTRLKARLPRLDRALNPAAYARADRKAGNATSGPSLASLLREEHCDRYLNLVEVVSGKPRRARGRGAGGPGWSVTTRPFAAGADACKKLAALAESS